MVHRNANLGSHFTRNIRCLREEHTVATSPCIRSDHGDIIKTLTFSSSKVKPRPALTLVLYLNVGHRTAGRSVFTGLGASLAAFSRRFTLLLFFLPGWSNQVLTYLSQCFLKWALGITPFLLGAIPKPCTCTSKRISALLQKMIGTPHITLCETTFISSHTVDSNRYLPFTQIFPDHVVKRNTPMWAWPKSA